MKNLKVVRKDDLTCQKCGSTDIEYAGSSNSGIAICRKCGNLVAKFP